MTDLRSDAGARRDRREQKNFFSQAFNDPIKSEIFGRMLSLYYTRREGGQIAGKCPQKNAAGSTLTAQHVL